jgi:hypothetical protein
MTNAKPNPQRINKRTLKAYHEAGHVVVALAVSIPVRMVWIDGVQARKWNENLVRERPADDRREHLAFIVAGCVAEFILAETGGKERFSIFGSRS